MILQTRVELVELVLKAMLRAKANDSTKLLDELLRQPLDPDRRARIQALRSEIQRPEM